MLVVDALGSLEQLRDAVQKLELPEDVPPAEWAVRVTVGPLDVLVATARRRATSASELRDVVAELLDDDLVVTQVDAGAPMHWRLLLETVRLLEGPLCDGCMTPQAECKRRGRSCCPDCECSWRDAWKGEGPCN